MRNSVNYEEDYNTITADENYNSELYEEYEEIESITKGFGFDISKYGFDSKYH